MDEILSGSPFFAILGLVSLLLRFVFDVVCVVIGLVIWDRWFRKASRL